MDEDNHYSSMYGHTDDDDDLFIDTSPSIGERLTATMTATTATLTGPDGRSVIVPTMAYVKYLENALEDTARTVRAMKAQMNVLRHAINTHTQDINGIGRALDRKADFFG